MSFKRDGNDGSWLRSLQKRRVSELLSEDIPRDEAHLMRNGKFACMVCQHRPVFDTVNVLSVHRAGKKHQASVSQKEAENEELERLKLARLHEEYVNSGLINKDLLKTVSTKRESTFLGAIPYDPRSKRPDRRKRALDLSGSNDVKKSSTDFNLEQPPQTIAEYRQFMKLKNDQLNVNIKPYTRRDSPGVQLVKTVNYLDNVLETNPRQHSSTSCQPNSTNMRQETVTLNTTSMNDTLNATSMNDKQMNKSHPFGKKKGVTKKHMITSEADLEKSELNEKYLKALASGWKKDRSGAWIKDDDVEFDSDEEPPNIP